MPGTKLRQALLRAGLVILSLQVGCKHTPRQAMSDLWSGSRSEATPDQKKPEPSVTANVAATADSATKKPEAQREPGKGSMGPLTNGLAKSPADAIEVAADSKRSSDLDLAGYVASESGLPASERLDPASPQAIFTDRSDDQIEQLKAALSDDVERAKSPTRHAGGAHDVRVRVESMLARARSLFDLGKLREARHAATIANDLGDSARLDYSPDEERPIDLVQRIDDQLKEAAEQKSDVKSTDHSALKAATLPPGSAAQRAAKGSELESRPRRDWSLNVFRRDRKVPAPDASLVKATPIQSVNPAVVQISMEAAGESPQETDGAVVQANRSLTLTQFQESPAIVHQASGDSSTPIAFAPVDNLAHGEELFPRPNGSTSDPEVEDPPPEIEPIPEAWRPEIQDSPGRALPDEPGPPPADFEEMKPISPFRDVAGQSRANAEEQEQAEACQHASWNWLVGIAMFGLCAVVAFIWYRRGAT